MQNKLDLIFFTEFWDPWFFTTDGLITKLQNPLLSVGHLNVLNYMDAPA